MEGLTTEKSEAFMVLSNSLRMAVFHQPALPGNPNINAYTLRQKYPSYFQSQLQPQEIDDAAYAPFINVLKIE
mgnify:FL=1